MKPISFDNRYIKLGDDFFVETRPQPVQNPQLIKFNHDLAEELGLAETSLNAAENMSEGTAIFAGNQIPDGADPLAMAKLGVPTTRALAVVTTGEEVVRQQLLPGGIITRIATSFVRVGTFQFFLPGRMSKQ